MAFCCAWTMPAKASPAATVTASIPTIFFILVISITPLNLSLDLSRQRRLIRRPRSRLPQQHTEADDQPGHVGVADIAADHPFDDRLDQTRKYQQQSG